MYNFLIGGKTAASRSFVAYVFDHNSLCRQPLPGTPSRLDRLRASLAQDRHLIDVTTPTCTQNERISHGHSSNAKSL